MSSQLSITNRQGPARISLAPAAFSVSARVAMQLGRESIASSNTAIVELVKNAYDADARRVKLKFTGLGTEDATLVVSDNGHGMTEDELRDHWLCIGTTNKQDSRFSKAGRVQTGEKGLGRLGLDRLCQRTTLQTRRKLSSEEEKQPELFSNLKPSAVELDIQWDRYQARGQRLETIAHEIYSLDHLDFDPISGDEADFSHGTRMILRGLKDIWNKERLTELSNELSLVLSPFADRADFSIEIETGLHLVGVDGDVLAPDDLLDQATWKVEAKIVSSITEQGAAGEKVSITMSSAQHKREYKLAEAPIPWREWMSHGTKEGGAIAESSKCGPVRFLMHVFVQAKGSGSEDSDQSANVRSFLSANRGIRIYRDGFRVKPYGDPSGANDWLRLAMRRSLNPAARSRKSWKLAYHQAVGAILISQVTNPNLKDQTNREGLSENEALFDLTAFAEKVVSWFEAIASEDYQKQNPREPKKAKVDPLSDPKNALARAEDAVAQLALAVSSGADGQESPPAAAEVALHAVQAARIEVSAIEKSHEAEVADLREEAEMVRSLASLGIMAAYFGHERVGDAGSVRQKMAELRRLIKNPNDSLFSSEEEKLETVELLEAGVMRLESFARFALDTVRPWKRTEPPADLVEVVHRTVSTFRDSLVRSGIKVEPSDIQGSWKEFIPLPVQGRTVQWECVITNLMVNALWALRQKVSSERMIRLSIDQDDGFVVFVFEDSGVGLEAGTEGNIFRAGFSTKRDHQGKQEGTGLGLTLVKSFVEEAGGSIAVIAKGELGGARFEIKAPIRQI
ncbi:ATP-binding protein [Luteolibacter arcticus]|uniref:histidine kinase n=1 Tax=Luteolibacter arcticus TaxID=1581411 RepID=A0ABT3GQR5_9BACT|nr:sensor histidine kinase [Luteolibacter arcticus]MCW1925811.1 ATP-binding protein [Luteolibacter arcticus]